MSDTSRPVFHAWLIRLCLFTLTIIAASPLIVGLARPLPRGGSSTTIRPSSPVSAHSPASAPRHYVIEVTGKEFQWRFRVHSPAELSGESPLASIVRLPAGATVDWQLTSDDYIYIFAIPELGIRRVAVPGLSETWHSGPLKPAAYDLMVDPICGFRFWHDELMGRVIIEATPAVKRGKAT